MRDKDRSLAVHMAEAKLLRLRRMRANYVYLQEYIDVTIKVTKALNAPMFDEFDGMTDEERGQFLDMMEYHLVGCENLMKRILEREGSRKDNPPQTPSTAPDQPSCQDQSS